MTGYVKLRDCVPGDVVLAGSSYWRILEVREPRHGGLGAHGYMTAVFDVWSQQHGFWFGPRHYTIRPDDAGHRDYVIVLSPDTVASIFPTLTTKD